MGSEGHAAASRRSRWVRRRRTSERASTNATTTGTTYFAFSTTGWTHQGRLQSGSDHSGHGIDGRSIEGHGMSQSGQGMRGRSRSGHGIAGRTNRPASQSSTIGTTTPTTPAAVRFAVCRRGCSSIHASRSAALEPGSGSRSWPPTPSSAAVMDAAFTCFAEKGYDGTTTAAICRAAGIGSGTFFHYFPTKAGVLVGLLELGTRETRDWFTAQQGRDDAREVVLDWVRKTADDVADPRMPGFVRAVGAVMTEPAVAAALADDEAAQLEGLRPFVLAAQRAGRVRTDLSGRALTSWVLLVLDGYLGRLATDDAFTASGQRRTLVDAVERLLA